MNLSMRECEELKLMYMDNPRERMGTLCVPIESSLAHHLHRSPFLVSTAHCLWPGSLLNIIISGCLSSILIDYCDLRTKSTDPKTSVSDYK